VGVTIKLRGDTAANWLTANPVLAAREVGLELDTQLYKVGDGVSNWDSLTYWGQMPAHNHNDQYYTESEIVTLLGGFAALNSENLFYEYQTLRGVSPTLRFRDTDHRSAHLHINNNLFYILRGADVDSPTWAQYNGYWPVQVNLENNDVTFGGNVYRRGAEVMSEGSKVYRNTTLGLSSGVWTTVIFDTVIQEQAAWAAWDTSSAIYPKRNGLYLIVAQGAIATTATLQTKGIRILRTGNDIGMYDTIYDLGSFTNLGVVGIYPLSVNQYVQLQAYCSGGSPVVQSWRTHLSLIYLGQGN